MCQFDASAIFADADHVQVMSGDHFCQPVWDPFVDLDLHYDSVRGKHGKSRRFFVEKQVTGLVLKRSVERHAQADVVVRPNECLSFILHDADGAQIVLPQEGVDFVEHRFIVGTVFFRELAVVAQVHGVAIGEHDAALLRDTIDSLLDLDEDICVHCQRFISHIATNAQLAAELDAIHLFPITAHIRRVVIQAGKRVSPIAVAMFIGEEVGTQRLLENLCLFERDDVFEFEAIETSDGVTKV